MDDHPEHQFNPLDHGLFRIVVDHDEVITGQFNRARAERKFVGTCRECGGHLVPLDTLPTGSSHIEWSEASCVLCHKEYASPWGKTLRRSSRHTEMPHGWWEHRMGALTEGN